MKKVVLLSMTAFVAVIIGIIAWVFVSYFINSQTEDRNAKEFIEEKYGMEVKIVDEKPADFVDFHTYQMAPTEQEDVVFTVEVSEENYSTIYRDDYKAVRKEHELHQQVEKLMPQIERIGFSASSPDERVEHVVKDMRTGEAVHWLNLKTDKSYETIERSEIQELKSLLDLQRENNIDVQKIIIESKREEHFVVLDMREMGEVQSIEDVEKYIIGSDLRLAGERMQAKWQDAAAQAETERFRFHDQWKDQWISCHQVNDAGDCVNLLANVTFSPGELSRENPHLVEDLDAIFNFFDSIEPKLMTVDLVMVDPEREGDPVRFFLKERKNYESTQQLIEDLVKE